MAICGECGRETPDGFPRCANCGAPLERRPPREVRKTVTVVFCDVTGSTSLGESLDPESLRHVMARYFDAMRRAVEHHGGVVEKFIGDAVMAVFGIPQAHEDDALRAVRAAAEMRQQLEQLNVELRRDPGIELEVRIGVHSGDVVVGTQERLATGDAVNVAARLEQACPPGEVLIGDATMRLIRHGVEADAVPPLELRGKRDPVPAFRLVEVHADAAPTPRGLTTRMVGRDHQRRRLADALSDCVRDRTCGLFTILGAAGVGKSRLVTEFLRENPVAVVRGRCLPYGEGITYWPVVEIVKQLTGEASGRWLAERGADPAIGRPLASLLGDDRPASAEDIAWAVRGVVSLAASETPLVVVFDDLQWAEPTFLDLVEYLADWVQDAPVLIICMARPELLERRPSWGGGKLNATSVLLEPLDAAETDVLIEALLGESEDVPPELRERIRTAAGGNPLFVEEMLAMLRDSGSQEVRVPPTIQALLAARLDQLPPEERAVLERGSVEGQSFHRGAVQALGRDHGDVSLPLLRLTRTELLRRDRPLLPGEDAFRFRHLLIRDAAYDSLPKAVRADLHEAFAAWLEGHGETLVERDEIVGYHLEQAVRYQAELGPETPERRSLADAAADRLARCGRRAIERGDLTAARTLLARAIELWPADRIDVALELNLAQAEMMSGDPRRALARATRLRERAAAAGNRAGALHAELGRVRIAAQTDPEGVSDALRALIDEARPVFEAEGYDAGLAALWIAMHTIEHGACRFDAAREAGEHALEHARRCGDRELQRLIMPGLVNAAAMGSTPIDQVLPWLDELTEVYGPQAWIESPKASMLAFTGRIEEARQLHRTTIAALEERGVATVAAILAQTGYEIEMLDGDVAAAEQIARRGCEQLQAMGERGWLSTQACMLGDALARLGRDAEAAEWIELGRSLGASDDVITQVLARQVLARLAVRRGDAAEGEALAREAVRLASAMDDLVQQGNAHANLAEVLSLAGRPDAAREELARAEALYGRKGATACVTAARRRLAPLET